MRNVSCQIQTKLKNRIDWNVLGELSACTSKLGDKSSVSDEEENGGREDADGELETEPLMAGKDYSVEKNEELKGNEETEKSDEDRERNDRSITKRDKEISSQKNILEDEREALIGEVVSTREGTCDKQCIPVSNLNITEHTRQISGPSGFAVSSTESTVITKLDEDGDKDLSSKDLLCFAWQVAKGMVSIKEGEKTRK